MLDCVSQFREAIHAAGLTPPDVIEPGRIHRFNGEGKANGNSAGWCKLFADSLGGVFGDWSTGLSEHWQAERDKPMTQADREAQRRQIEEAKAEAEAQLRERQAEAAKKAAATWAAAATPGDHDYLLAKGINAYGIRQHNDALVIPLRIGADLHSLQFIDSDGGKRFLGGGRVAGCYFSIGNPKGADALAICEGFATGASIHEATGLPVAVAFNAGNLMAVAIYMRERFPDLRLILCADDDWKTEGNPGLTKATEAACAVGGAVVVPTFGDGRPDGLTDFNDMAVVCGLEAVARAVVSATPPALGEHQPVSLIAVMEPPMIGVMEPV